MDRRRPANLRRYHKDKFFPENVGHMCLEFFGQIDRVNVTYHSAEQLIEDPRGVIPLPTKQQLMEPSNQLIELYEILDAQGNATGRMQKALIRVRNLNDKFDYCYVLAREGFIVSAWANDKTDNHRLTAKGNDYYVPIPDVLADVEVPRDIAA